MRRILLWGCLCWCAVAGAQALPPVVARDTPMLVTQGEGTMRWFGIKVYDIRLWTMMKT